MEGLEGLGDDGAGVEVEERVAVALLDRGDELHEGADVDGVPRLEHVAFGGQAVGDADVGGQGAERLATVLEHHEVLGDGAVVVRDVLEGHDAALEGHAAFEGGDVAEVGLQGDLEADTLEIGGGELAALAEAAEEHGTLFVADDVVVAASGRGDGAEQLDATADGFGDGVAFGLRGFSGHAESGLLAGDGDGVVAGVEVRGVERVGEFGVGLSQLGEGEVTLLLGADSGGTLLEAVEAVLVDGEAETIVGTDVTDGDVRGCGLVERDGEVACTARAAVLALGGAGANAEVLLVRVEDSLLVGLSLRVSDGVELTATRFAILAGEVVVARPDGGDFASVDVVDDVVCLRVELGRIVDGAHGCMGGWRSAVEQVCYPLSTPRPYFRKAECHRS